MHSYVLAVHVAADGSRRPVCPITPEHLTDGAGRVVQPWVWV
jgi:hypothetical protein